MSEYVPDGISTILERISQGSDWKLEVGQFIDDFRRVRGANAEVRGDLPKVEDTILALFAATTVSLAIEMGVHFPKWATEVQPLKNPFFPSGVENLKASALMESPAAFKRLNIFVLGNFLSRA